RTHISMKLNRTFIVMCKAIDIFTLDFKTPTTASSTLIGIPKIDPYSCLGANSPLKNELSLILLIKTVSPYDQTCPANPSSYLKRRFLEEENSILLYTYISSSCLLFIKKIDDDLSALSFNKTVLHSSKRLLQNSHFQLGFPSFTNCNKDLTSLLAFL